MQVRWLKIGPLLLMASACFSLAQTQSESATGIEGRIMIGPIRPGPIKAGSDIPRWGPFGNTTFVVQNEKGTVTTFTTDDQGRFRVLVAPGHYTVSRKDQASVVGHYGPFDVDVVEGKMTKVEWGCDSGMR
jgi:hypothetical protein